MGKLVPAAQRWLADTWLLRRLRGHLLSNQVRGRAVEIDGLDVAKCQKRTLSSLIHQARATRFGRDHDFARIRSAADFRRLVPLRTPEVLWQNYWQPHLPLLDGVTWPGPLFRSEGKPLLQGAFMPLVPLSGGLIAAHHAALVSALALSTLVRPEAYQAPWFLLGPSLCYAGSQLPLARDGKPLLESWWGRLRRHGPFRGPYRVSPEEPEQEGLADLAAQLASLEIRCLAGTAGQLRMLLDQVKRQAKCGQFRDIWPTLEVVLVTADSASSDQDGLRQTLSNADTVLLETYLPVEGPVAVEDPRHGLLRFLPDVGSYGEFVPVAELAKPTPTRHEISEIEPGIPYALALSSPAGLWACLTGARVCFEYRYPPLFQLVKESPSPQEESPSGKSVPLSTAHPFPAQPPHRNGSLPELPYLKDLPFPGGVQGRY